MSATSFLTSSISIVSQLLQPFIILLNFIQALSRLLVTYLYQFCQPMTTDSPTISSISANTSLQESQSDCQQQQGSTTHGRRKRLFRWQAKLYRWIEILIEWVEWVMRVGIIGVIVACAPVGWTIRGVGEILRGVRWVLEGAWVDPLRVWIGLVGVEETLGQVSEAIIGEFGGKSARRRKTLVLDLDETLVHSKLKVNGKCDLRLQVNVDEFPTSFYVSKRPYLDVFLRTAAQWYNVVIFTASLKQYADPLINLLDPNGLVCGRYFRESCAKQAGNFVKDLRVVEPDLRDVLIVDNSPSAYSMHAANAVPIEPWYDDQGDEELLNLLPLLHAIAPLQDVRSLLALRLSGGVLAAKSAYGRYKMGS